MYIQRNFYDFYDSAIGVGGIDKTCIYDRKMEFNLIEIDVGKSRKTDFICEYTLPKKLNDKKLWVFSEVVIGFAGKIYPCCRAECGEVFSHFYDINSWAKFLKSKGEDIFSIKRKNNNRSRYLWDEKLIEETGLKKFFDINEWKWTEKFFLEYKTPIFAIVSDKIRYKNEKCNIIINPCLKDFDFMKIIDPFTAFQEIYMFLSGILVKKEKPIPEMDDETMRDAKGFDKWSFKRPPNTKQ